MVIRNHLMGTAILILVKGILTIGIFFFCFRMEPILVAKVPYDSIFKLFLVMKKD